MTPQIATVERVRVLRLAGRSQMQIAAELAVSRSFVERCVTQQRSDTRQAACTPERQAAGHLALPVGHPLAAMNERA